MRTRHVFLSFLALFMAHSVTSAVRAQVSFKVPITATSGVLSRVVTLGVHPGNTIGIDTDPGLGEFQEAVAPQLPPTVLLDARCPVGPGTAIFMDIRGYSSPDQADIYYVTVQGDYLITKTLTLSWPSILQQFASSWTIKTVGSSKLIPTNMGGVTQVSIPPDGLTTALTFEIVKVGAFPPTTAGPTFVLDRSSLYFGAVGVGLHATQGVKVSNTGATVPLTIRGAALPSDFSLSPSTFPITVPPGTDKTFDVTFSPLSPGNKTANILFSHNAPGDSTSLLVSGNGLLQLGTLFFSANQKTAPDNTTGVTDTLGIHVSGFPLHAVQFTLNTSGQIIFRSIRHTLDPAKWALSYEVFRGSVNPYFATDDSVRIVLYGLNSNSLPALDYPAAMLVTYDIVNIAAPNATSRLELTNILGSLFDGSDGNVNSAGDELITVLNRTAKGDVNLDDRINILDVLMLVDHITGRLSLSGSQYSAADMYPYPFGDGAVNVQDLSLLQRTILTGLYPDSSRTAKVAPIPWATASDGRLTKMSPDRTQLTMKVSREGIEIRLRNAVPVKGVQLTFRNIRSVAPGLRLSSIFSEAHCSLHEDGLTLLLYGTMGDPVGPGDQTIARLSLGIRDPSGVSIARLIIADEANTELAGVETSVSTDEGAGGIPASFSMAQNYPNPFNPSTQIQFSVPKASDVRVTVYNTLGQEVRRLFTGEATRGSHSVQWDGRDNDGHAMSSGVYIYRMSSGNFEASRKMILVR